MAQLGRALGSGPRGRWFKSSHPDQSIFTLTTEALWDNLFMDTRRTHPSFEQVTVKPVDGGWVSYVDPQVYPKSRFGETKPYFAPESIFDLRGPDCGSVKLPHAVYWGPDRWFNLTRRSSLRLFYQTVLQEGSIEDINIYLDREILLSIWNELLLPPRVIHLWEYKVKGLSNV